MAGVPVVGIQGKGKAGVFGDAVNPLAVRMQYMQRQQQNQMLLDKEDRERRDALISDYRKWNPDKAWEPFHHEVADYVDQNVRGTTRRLLAEGAPLSVVQRETERAQSDANTLVAESNWKKAQFEDYNKRIAKEVDDGNFMPDYYEGKLNDRFFTSTGAKFLKDVPTDHDVIFKDSKGYNVPSIVERFMTSLPEMINADETEKWGKLGVTYDIQDTSDKLGLQFDQNRKVVIDPRTNRPAIAMTNEVFMMAQKNPYLKQIVEDNLGADATQEKKKEFLTGLLKGYNPVEIKNSIQLGHKIDKDDRRYFAFGTGFKNDVADLEDRDQRYEDIVNNNRPDLLESVNDTDSDLQGYYADAKGKPILPGDPRKPSKLIMGYVGMPEGNEMSPEKWAAMSTQDKILYQVAKGKVLKKNEFDLNTEEGKRKAKIALSLRQDKIDPKRAIGEEYTTYVEVKRKKSPKKKESGGYDPKNPL